MLRYAVFSLLVASALAGFNPIENGLASVVATVENFSNHPEITARSAIGSLVSFTPKSNAAIHKKPLVSQKDILNRVSMGRSSSFKAYDLLRMIFDGASKFASNHNVNFKGHARFLNDLVPSLENSTIVEVVQPLLRTLGLKIFGIIPIAAFFIVAGIVLANGSLLLAFVAAVTIFKHSNFAANLLPGWLGGNDQQQDHDQAAATKQYSAQQQQQQYAQEQAYSAYTQRTPEAVAKH